MSVDGAISLLNPLVAALLRSPLHRVLSSGLLLLTVTGRHSGHRYSIPVGYQRDGDDLVVMVSEARRKQLIEAAETLGARDLEKVIAFAEFVKARRSARAFAHRHDGHDGSEPPPAPAGDESDLPSSQRRTATRP